jgi:hypothetical protein
VVVIHASREQHPATRAACLLLRVVAERNIRPSRSEKVVIASSNVANMHAALSGATCAWHSHQPGQIHSSSRSLLVTRLAATPRLRRHQRLAVAMRPRPASRPSSSTIVAAAASSASPEERISVDQVVKRVVLRVSTLINATTDTASSTHSALSVPLHPSLPAATQKFTDLNIISAALQLLGTHSAQIPGPLLPAAQLLCYGGVQLEIQSALDREARSSHRVRSAMGAPASASHPLMNTGRSGAGEDAALEFDIDALSNEEFKRQLMAKVDAMSESNKYAAPSLPMLSYRPCPTWFSPPSVPLRRHLYKCLTLPSFLLAFCWLGCTTSPTSGARLLRVMGLVSKGRKQSTPRVTTSLANCARHASMHTYPAISFSFLVTVAHRRGAVVVKS